MAKIILADSPMNNLEVARDLLPPDLDMTVARFGSPEFNAALAEADCLVGFGEGAMDDAFYRRAPKLKLVQLLSAGYDRVDIEAARRARIPVCNNGGANSTAVSEHAILLMLAICRRIVWQHENVAAGRWRGNNVEDVRLYNCAAARWASSAWARSGGRPPSSPTRSAWTCGPTTRAA